jgi:hypothetical protein
MVSWDGEMKTTPTPTLSLEKAPSKNIFQIGPMEGEASGEAVGCFLSLRGGSRSISEL